MSEPGRLRARLLLPSFPEPALIRTNYPIMLMHGFGTTSGLGRKGNYHEAAMALRSHGVWAYAPNVAPYHTIATRAEMWAERMAHILEETHAPKVNLIAHSMGGLDARYLISRLGQHTHVASLTTIATPHRGSALASFVLKQPATIKKALMYGAHALGTLTSPDTDADFLSAVDELQPDFITNAFNPATPDHPDIPYWSYAGAAGRGSDIRINPVMLPLNQYLFAKEGLNDGFVSTASAPWGTFCGTLPADHAQQIGVNFPGASSFRANTFYASVAEMLASRGL